MWAKPKEPAEKWRMGTKEDRAMACRPLLDRGRTIAKPGFNIHRIQSAYEAVAGLSGIAKQMRVSAIMWGKA
jgi:hypothetical protein